jgi:hypothetical protein
MASRGYHMPSGQVSVYSPTLSTDFTSNLWRTCPLIEYLHDPQIGVLYDESFTGYDTTNDWTATHVTTGSEVISTTVPGALLLDAGASTAHQGTQTQRLKTAFVPASGKDIWFECQALVGTALTIETFIGLAASDTTIIASGSMSTNNRIGWTSVTGDGVLLFDCDKAGTNTTQAAVTLSITVWHKLGFYYDGTADTITQYIDGVATGTAVATADIAKLVIYPSIVCQASGTTQPTLTVRGLRVFQLR